jgi:hypothetical protein
MVSSPMLTTLSGGSLLAKLGNPFDVSHAVLYLPKKKKKTYAQTEVITNYTVCSFFVLFAHKAISGYFFPAPPIFQEKEKERKLGVWSDVGDEASNRC